MLSFVHASAAGLQLPPNIIRRDAKQNHKTFRQRLEDRRGHHTAPILCWAIQLDENNDLWIIRREETNE